VNGIQEAALHSGFISFRGVFSRLPDPTMVLDHGGRVLDINAAAERALSRSRPQLLGATLSEIGASSAIVRRFDEVLQRVLRDGTARETVVAVETPRGEFHWEVRFYPHRGDGEEVPMVLGVFRDVTRVVRRQRELEGRSSELSQLGDSLCHDLRSPIATVRSFIDFLVTDVKAQDESQIEADIEMIQNAVEKMTELLTSISRRTRKSDIRDDGAQTSLSDLVSDSLALLGGVIATRQAVVDVTDEPWVLRGDRGSFVEIFENLIENAVKFTNRDERPRVGITVEEWRGAPTICVRDQGIGIEARELERVFDRYEQLDGTGMGLFLVKALVERLGGDVSVESPGRGLGTTVRLTPAEMYKKNEETP